MSLDRFATATPSIIKSHIFLLATLIATVFATLLAAMIFFYHIYLARVSRLMTKSFWLLGIGLACNRK